MYVVCGQLAQAVFVLSDDYRAYFLTENASFNSADLEPCSHTTYYRVCIICLALMPSVSVGIRREGPGPKRHGKLYGHRAQALSFRTMSL